jgi:monoamine oxidase
MVTFVPELPADKARAIEGLKFGAGMKVIFGFRSRFWKPDIAIIAGGAFATYWPPVGNQFSNDNVLTAFAVGEHADRLNANETQVVELLLGELDSFFGGHAATQNFLDSYTMNWSKERFIGGYATYPNSSSYFENKAALAQPVQGRVFFAGEATNTECDSLGYVHGAMATGARAAKELMATIQG